MGYHHDHDWLQNHQESLCDPFVLPRAERQDLQPLEVRRMLCVGLGSEDAIHASAAELAEHLLNLGYRHVFCLV
jgi:hypothetical protein